MKKFKIVDELNDLISGAIDVKALTAVVEERLFKLRQKPDLTPEQELLSSLELYIHEAEEGYRSWDELYEYALSIIESDISERFVKTITLNASATEEFQTISQAIPVKEYRHDLSPV